MAWNESYNALFSAYEKRLTYIIKLILFLRVFSWRAIAYIFFLSSYVSLTWKFLGIISRSFHSSKPNLDRHLAKYIDSNSTTIWIEKKTDNVYKKKHYGVVDTERTNEQDTFILKLVEPWQAPKKIRVNIYPRMMSIIQETPTSNLYKKRNFYRPRSLFRWKVKRVLNKNYSILYKSSFDLFRDNNILFFTIISKITWVFLFHNSF